MHHQHFVCILNKFMEISVDTMNKIHQNVIATKFMFKMSTICTNTCVQTTTPWRSRCHDDGVVQHQQPSLPQQTRRSFTCFTSRYIAKLRTNLLIVPV